MENSVLERMDVRREIENEEIEKMEPRVKEVVDELNLMLPSMNFKVKLDKSNKYYSYSLSHKEDINLKELIEELKIHVLNSDFFLESVKRKVSAADIDELLAGDALEPFFLHLERGEDAENMKIKKKYFLKSIKRAAESLLNYGVRHQDESMYWKELLSILVKHILSENLGVDTEVEPKYKFSFVFDGKAECRCGEVFDKEDIKQNEYSANIDYYVCPNCLNSEFKILRKEDREPQIWDISRYVFTPEDKFSKNMVKMHKHLYMVGTWGGYVQRYRGYFKRVTMNLKTKRAFYLSKSKEKYNWQIQAFKPMHAEYFDDEHIKRFLEAFLSEREEYRSFFEAIIEDSEDGFADVGEGISESVLYQFLLKLAVVLNRNPEIFQMMIYAYKNDTDLMKVIVDNVLFNYPKGNLSGSPQKVLSKIIGTEINSSVIRDYNKGKVSAKELYAFGELVRLFGVDNARDLFSEVYGFLNRDMKAVFTNIVKNSPDKTVAKRRVLKLFKSDDFGLEMTELAMELQDIMRMKFAIEENGGEKVDVDLSNLSLAEAKDIHDNLVALLNSIHQKINKQKFKSVVKTLSSYEHEGEDLKIVAPKKPEDITEEGIAMNHCVAGYVTDVADRRTKIFFLRDKDNNRQATIEVKRNKVWQVKRRRNDPPTAKMMDFIKSWAEKKKLQFDGSW